MSKRSEKIAETIHETVSTILCRGLNDPRIGFVTITSVEVTDDLSLARIYFSVIGDEASKKSSEIGLNHAKGYIRKELGRALSIRYLPDVVFKYDHSQDYGNRIDSILREIGSEHDGDNPANRK